MKMYRSWYQCLYSEKDPDYPNDWWHIRMITVHPHHLSIRHVALHKDVFVNLPNNWTFSS